MEKSTTRTTLLVLVAILGFLGFSVLCCCGGAWFGAPKVGEAMVSLVFQEEPLSIPDVPTNPEVTFDELKQRFEAGGTVVFTGPEIDGALKEAGGDDTQVAFELRGSKARLDLSVVADERYLNVHAVARGRMEEGQMTEFFFDELTFGGINLGIVAGENMAKSFNENVREQPELEEMVRRIQLAEVRDGALHLQLTPAASGEDR